MAGYSYTSVVGGRGQGPGRSQSNEILFTLYQNTYSTSCLLFCKRGFDRAGWLLMSGIPFVHPGRPARKKAGTIFDIFGMTLVIYLLHVQRPSQLPLYTTKSAILGFTRASFLYASLTAGSRIESSIYTAMVFLCRSTIDHTPFTLFTRTV